MLNRTLLSLNMINGLGSVRLKALLNHFSSAENILKASEKDLIQVEGIGIQLAKLIISQRNKIDIEEELMLIADNKIDIVTYLDDTYPQYLKKIYDPPMVLYVKGSLPKNDELSIAVVGSRRASYYGLSVAEKIAAQLAQLGINIISGLARGIDTAAHKGVLKSGGKTVAVLGSGLGNIYPQENKALAEEITENGAVISEFPFNTPPLAVNFPRRNRIISGLSQGVVIVEAAQKSGAIITADCALEQGREVFAVPGKLDSFTSSGTNKLIKQGAKLIQGVEDILEEFNMKIENKGSSHFKQHPLNLEGEENSLYSLFSNEPIHIDNLIHQGKINTQEAARILLKLQLKHLVKELPGKNFVRING